MAQPDETHLCLTCGICCGEALFDYGRLTPEELPTMRRLGLSVGTFGEFEGFAIPCVQLAGKTCQVYHDRPGTCRKYQCTTLAALEQGEIDRCEADRRVAATLAAIDQVRGHLPPDETLMQARGRLRDAGPVSASFKLAFGVLDLLLDRFFRKPHQRRLRPDGEALAAMDAPAPAALSPPSESGQPAASPSG